jgi:hypothetical protein
MKKSSKSKSTKKYVYSRVELSERLDDIRNAVYELNVSSTSPDDMTVELENLADSLQTLADDLLTE